MGGGACLIFGLDCLTSGLDCLMSDLVSDLSLGRDYAEEEEVGGGDAEAKAWEEVPVLYLALTVLYSTLTV